MGISEHQFPGQKPFALHLRESIFSLCSAHTQQQQRAVCFPNELNNKSIVAERPGRMGLAAAAAASDLNYSVANHRHSDSASPNNALTKCMHPALLGQRLTLGRRDGQKVVTSKQHKANTFYKLNLSIISAAVTPYYAPALDALGLFLSRRSSPVSRACINYNHRAHHFTTSLALALCDKMHFDAPRVICQHIFARAADVSCLTCKARQSTLPALAADEYADEGVALPIVVDFISVPGQLQDLLPHSCLDVQHFLT
jgi:hypothetical protein